MTPAARVQAAIEIIEVIRLGTAAEKALTNWARGARYAGSKDRAAVRDHVFDVLRRWRSTAALGGDETGRARMLGLLREAGTPVEALFSGVGHAPAPLGDGDAPGSAPQGFAAWDLPDWLAERLIASLGEEEAREAAVALRVRAPVFLRVNTLKSDRDSAAAALADEGIVTAPHPISPTAMEVTEGARRVARSAAYLDGRVELQDGASQAVVDLMPLVPGMRVLDFCAGGGGKALAMAARLDGPVTAHDADPGRMSDLPGRATRAGALVRVEAEPAGPFDLVLCDVPCSGSGAWRRAPEGKWRLQPEALDRLRDVQSAILDRCAGLVAPGGTLAYATCSMLDEENGAQIRAFLARHPGWRLEKQRQFLPKEGGDGFFLACLQC